MKSAQKQEQQHVPFDAMDKSKELFVLQTLQRLYNMDPSDRTKVRCDICNIEGDKGGLGGVILKEPVSKLGENNTIVCQECFDTFVCADEETRAVLSKELKYQPAWKHRIGIDCVSFLQLDAKENFQYNVLLWRKQNPLLSQFKAMIGSKRLKEPAKVSDSAPLPKIDGSFKMSCNGCHLFKDEHELKKCMQCLLARYCSKDCQRKDWPQHKAMCKRLDVLEKNKAFEEFVKKENVKQ